MWCPSVSLAVWANAWQAGLAAPDDVLDALSLWAPRHSVAAYDATAATRTGLPWPDLTNFGGVTLLQTLRSAAGATRSEPAFHLLLPVPGDVRGLAPGTRFQTDAIGAGEAVVISSALGEAVGMVPDFEYEDETDEAEVSALSWTVYSLSSAPATPHFDLAEEEYRLREAVRSAAEALNRLRAEPGADVDDPRAMVEQLIEAGHLHRLPDHAPPRAVRVLETAAHVDAIVTVGAGLAPIGLQSASEMQLAGDAVRPLADVVRSARLAAVGAIMHSAWERY
ncbi:hypothetical protein [Mycobacterium sp. OTB74]|jgi:hypothetical protein|uniref:hypothetical protein n=1 Tax=Mycobacterium sp. OTB74 TaxID=1853452 RepID=UPI0024747A7A|nr:hypothetical protein [Mycobacterium sp. OTB74]MDH6244172.1 hypothetical protein [Mycobacterium sp. OTB74]